MELRRMNRTDGALLAGRLLLSASLLPPAVAHLSNISGLAARISAEGILYAEVIATAVALTETVGPLSVVIGLAPRLSAGALLTTSLAMSLILHRFWDIEGAARQLEQTLFVAQLGTTAALLLYLVTGPGAWSWQGWRSKDGQKRKPTPKKKPSRPRTTPPRPVSPRPAATDDELADAA